VTFGHGPLADATPRARAALRAYIARSARASTSVGLSDGPMSATPTDPPTASTISISRAFLAASASPSTGYGGPTISRSA